MGKRRTKIGSIKSIGALRDVHLLTLAAIDLDSILTKLVAHCIWHDFMLVTKGARAVAISTLKVLSVNKRQSYSKNMLEHSSRSEKKPSYLQVIECSANESIRTDLKYRYSAPGKPRFAALPR